MGRQSMVYGLSSVCSYSAGYGLQFCASLKGSTKFSQTWWQYGRGKVERRCVKGDLCWMSVVPVETKDAVESGLAHLNKCGKFSVLSGKEFQPVSFPSHSLPLLLPDISVQVHWFLSHCNRLWLENFLFYITCSYIYGSRNFISGTSFQITKNKYIISTSH